MSDVRPSGEGDGAARLLASARTRLHAITADLALPNEHRLTEWQRTTVAALLATLVRDLEDELRGHLLEQPPPTVPEALRAALASAALPLAVPVLKSTPLVAEPQLVGLLMRRAEEHRLTGTSLEQGVLAILAGDDDAAVAAAAMGLLVARNSRFDAFQEPVVGRSDLPADLRYRLLWTVAAALRGYMVGQHRLDAGLVDQWVAAAVGVALPGYDEGAGVEARAVRLAGLLAARGRIDDGLAARAGEEGNLPLLLALLAYRAGLPLESAWELLTDEAGAPLLMRGAGVGRAAAGTILLRLGGASTAAARLDRFDTLSETQAARLIAPWRVDPAYRAAIAVLAS